MFPCKSKPSPTATPDPPSSCGKADAKAAETHAGQPHRLARRESRFPAPSGPAPCLPRRGLHPLPPPRPRRRPARHDPAPGPGPAHRPQTLARTRPGPGHGRGTAAPPRLEARHLPAMAHHHAGPRARLGRRRRGRPLRGDGLAARAPGSHRAPARPTPPARRRAGVRRRERELLRGAHLPAGAFWLQPRRASAARSSIPS